VINTRTASVAVSAPSLLIVAPFRLLVYPVSQTAVACATSPLPSLEWANALQLGYGSSE